MAFLRITERVTTPVPAILFDLLHGGKVTIGGRVIRLEDPVLPAVVREADHLRWVFSKPVRVSTPGPDSSVTEIKQYRDRIEFSVWPWANIRIEFQQ